jgi:hypothetical protein
MSQGKERIRYTRRIRRERSGECDREWREGIDWASGIIMVIVLNKINEVEFEDCPQAAQGRVMLR